MISQRSRRRTSYVPSRYPRARTAYSHSRSDHIPQLGWIMLSVVLLSGASAWALRDYTPSRWRFAPPPRGRTSIELVAAAATGRPAEVRISAPPRRQLQPAATPMRSAPDVAMSRTAERLIPTASSSPPTRASSARVQQRRQSAETPPLDEATPIAQPKTQRPVAATIQVNAATPPSREQRGVRNRTAPRPTFSPQPDYPPTALAAGRAGLVLVRTTIDNRGRVTKASIARSSGSQDLDQAALQAVRRWRFQPVSPESTSAPDDFGVPIRFVLEK